jgi:DNA helicase II / ATP-dependent DNA helicase PcrA
LDKKVIFAVAGSGKTTEIVDRIDEERRFLIFTYTEENLLNLRKKIVAKHGRVPSSVSVMTYFSFLHSFCLRPLAGLKTRSRGINFDDDPPQGRYNDKQQGYYLDGARRIYVSRLAKAITKHYPEGLLRRIELFFDVVLVDEVQDFASHDFNLLLHLARANVEMLMVGDFLQHTYDTSRDGSTLKNLHKSFGGYAQRFRDAGIVVDTDSLSHSRRCSPAVCDFISANLGVPIKTHSDRPARIIPVESQAQADELRCRSDIVKLFYSKHRQYGCVSQNWGASKGEDHYDEVCVVLNKTTLAKYRSGELAALPPQTLNKLYVALSRSRGDVYLAPHTFFVPVDVDA